MGYAIGSCYKDASGWHYEFIHEQGSDAAVCIDGDGRLHMSYLDIGEEDLICAYRGEEAVEPDVRYSVSRGLGGCTAQPLLILFLRRGSPSWVPLEVYDASGRMVSEVSRKFLERGEHLLGWGHFRRPHTCAGFVLPSPGQWRRS